MIFPTCARLKFTTSDLQETFRWAVLHLGRASKTYLVDDSCQEPRRLRDHSCAYCTRGAMGTTQNGVGQIDLAITNGAVHGNIRTSAPGMFFRSHAWEGGGLKNALQTVKLFPNFTSKKSRHRNFSRDIHLYRLLVRGVD